MGPAQVVAPPLAKIAARFMNQLLYCCPSQLSHYIRSGTMYLKKQAWNVQELLHWVFRLTVVALAVSVRRAGQMAASGNRFRTDFNPWLRMCQSPGRRPVVNDCWIYWIPEASDKRVRNQMQILMLQSNRSPMWKCYKAAHDTVHQHPEITGLN